MPMVKNVERRIGEVERFEVHFFLNGSNVNGHKEGIPQYAKSRVSPGSWTIKEWKKKVFSQQYPGYDAVVLNGEGNEPHGGMTLDNLRDTY